MSSKSIFDKLQLNNQVFAHVNSNCFNNLFKDRGGNPFDPSNYAISFFVATITKTPAMYPKSGKKSKVRHWTFFIPALDPETEWEFDEHQILTEVNMTVQLPSSAIFITMDALGKLYDKLFKPLQKMIMEGERADIVIPTLVPNVRNDKEPLNSTTPVTSTSGFLSPLPINSGEFRDLAKGHTSDVTELIAMTMNVSPAGSTRSRVHISTDIKPGVDKGQVNLQFEYTTEDENAMENLKLSAKDEEIIRWSAIKDVETIIEVAYYDKHNATWFTKLCKQRIPPSKPGSQMSAEERRKWFEKYEIGQPTFRDESILLPKSFPRENFNGLFQYCGCLLARCKGNAVASTHWCRGCKRPMLGFCLVSTGSWGICRTCYFVKNISDKQSSEDTYEDFSPVIKSLKTKKPINATTKPSDIITSVKAKYVSAKETENNAELDTSAKSTYSITGNNDSVFKVVLDKGILVPPRPKEPYVVDELELLSHEPMAVVIDQLWSLLCLLTHAAFEVLLETVEAAKPAEERNNRKKGSPTCNYQHRFQNYYTLAEEILENFPDKEIGAFILGKFYKDEDTGKPEWPPSIHRKFASLKEKGNREWKTWQTKGGAKYFTDNDRRTLNTQVKVMTYVGSKIDEIKEDVQSMANTHINKHWPFEFKSGQSPSGLLYVIRKWYWEDQESPRRVNNSLKQWVSAERKRRNKKDNLDADDSDFEDSDDLPNAGNAITPSEQEVKRKEFEDKNKWNQHRFPDGWLAWYLYGPPKAGGHQLFTNCEMQLLNKIKASRKLTEEEEVVELGQLNKHARRTAKKNRTGKDVDSDQIEETGSVASLMTTQAIKWIKEAKPRTAADQLDRAIATNRELIAVLTETIASEGDPDGELADKIIQVRKQLRELLTEKIDECLEERAILKKKRSDGL